MKTHAFYLLRIAEPNREDVASCRCVPYTQLYPLTPLSLSTSFRFLAKLAVNCHLLVFFIALASTYIHNLPALPVHRLKNCIFGSLICPLKHLVLDFREPKTDNQCFPAQVPDVQITLLLAQQSFKLV